MTPRRVLWIASLALAWLAAIVAGYFVIHKPFGLEVAVSISRVVVDIAIGAGGMLLAGGLGRRLVLEAHPDGLSRAALQAALGLGVLALAILGLGAVGLLSPLPLWIVTLGAAVGLRHWISGWVGDLRAVRPLWTKAGLLGGASAVASAVIVLLALAEASAPPSHFDALVYHLTLPLDFLDQGSVAFSGQNPYWGMPLGMELLYTWAAGLGRPETAAVLGWMVGLVALLGVLALGQRFGARAGWVAVAALLCGQTLAESLGWAYADWLAAAEGVGLLIALDSWRQAPGHRRAALAGVMAGMAVSAKYTAGLGILAGGVYLLFANGVRRGWRPLLTFCVAAVLSVIPWLLKNQLGAGSPLFPFLGANVWVSADRQAWYRGGSGFGSILGAVLLPVRATLLGSEGAPGYASSLGPLLLGLVPGALLARRAQRGLVTLLGVYLLAGWAGWGIGSLVSPQLLQSRLYYVLYPAWAALAAAGFAGLSRIRVARVRFGRLAAALVLLSLSLSALGSIRAAVRFNTPAAALGITSPESYLAGRLGGYVPAMEAIEALGQGASVLMLWEARGLYCRPACLPDHWIDRWIADRHALGSADAILESWGRQGITHVLLYRMGADFVRQADLRYSEEDWRSLEGVVAALRPLSQIGDGYVLYEVPR